MRTPFLRKVSKKASSHYHCVEKQEREDVILRESYYNARGGSGYPKVEEDSKILSRRAEDNARKSFLFPKAGRFLSTSTRRSADEKEFPRDGAPPGPTFVDVLESSLDRPSTSVDRHADQEGSRRVCARALSKTEGSVERRTAVGERRDDPPDTMSVTSIFYDESFVGDHSRQGALTDDDDVDTLYSAEYQQYQNPRTSQTLQEMDAIFPDTPSLWTGVKSQADENQPVSASQSFGLETGLLSFGTEVLDELVSTQSEEGTEIFQDNLWASGDDDELSQSHTYNDESTLETTPTMEQELAHQKNPFDMSHDEEDDDTGAVFMDDIFPQDPLWTEGPDSKGGAHECKANEKTHKGTTVETQAVQSTTKSSSECVMFVQAVFPADPFWSESPCADGSGTNGCDMDKAATKKEEKHPEFVSAAVFKTKVGSDTTNEIFPMDLLPSSEPCQVAPASTDIDLIQFDCNVENTSSCNRHPLKPSTSDEDESLYTTESNTVDEATISRDDAVNETAPIVETKADNCNVKLVPGCVNLHSVPSSGSASAKSTNHVSAADESSSTASANAKCPHCMALEEELMVLRAQHKTDLLERDLQDEDLFRNMEMMKEYIELLDSESSLYSNEYESFSDDYEETQQTTTRNKTELEAKLRIFDEELECRANSFKAIEMEARLKDLEAENARWKAVLGKGEVQMGKENQDLKHRVEELEEERSLLLTKIQSQEAAVALMAQEEESLRQQLQKLEIELQRVVSKSVSEHSDDNEKASESSTTETCRSEKVEEPTCKISNDAQKDLIQKLRDELGQSNDLCLSQEETIAKLVEQVQQSLSMGENVKFQAAAEVANVGDVRDTDQELQAKIRALEIERNRLRTKCIAQGRTISKMQNASGSFLMPPIHEDRQFSSIIAPASEESADESDHAIFEETEEDVQVLKQSVSEKKKKAVTSLRECRKTSAEAARSKEERDERDARLRYLEDIIRSMTDSDSDGSSGRDAPDGDGAAVMDAPSSETVSDDDDDAHASRAARWKEKIRRPIQEFTATIMFAGKSKDDEEVVRGDGILC